MGLLQTYKILEVSDIPQTQEHRQVPSCGGCMNFTVFVITESFGLLSRPLVELYNPILVWSRISLQFNTANLCR
jgi:hypothetical protein